MFHPSSIEPVQNAANDKAERIGDLHHDHIVSIDAPSSRRDFRQVVCAVQEIMAACNFAIHRVANRHRDYRENKHVKNRDQEKSGGGDG